MDGISFFFVQDLITFQFSLKQIPRELIIRIIYKALPYKTFAISILMIVFAAGLFTYVSQLSVILYILLHYRMSSWLYLECAAPRGPTYPRCSGRINMLLDMTRVQCSASGVFLITVAASRCLGHLSWWVLPVVVIFPLYLYKTIPTYFLAWRKAQKDKQSERNIPPDGKSTVCLQGNGSEWNCRCWLSSLWMDYSFILFDLQCLHVCRCEVKLGWPLDFYTRLLAYWRNSYLSLVLIMPFLPPLDLDVEKSVFLISLDAVRKIMARCGWVHVSVCICVGLSTTTCASVKDREEQHEIG